MSVDRNGLWVVLAVCCAAAVVREGWRLRRLPPARSRRERIGRFVDAVLTALGWGMLAAFALAVVAVALEAAGV